MAIIFHIPTYVTEKACFTNSAEEAFKLGKMVATDSGVQFFTDVSNSYVIELTPPPIALSSAFFDGFFEGSIQQAGAGIVQRFTARCSDTKIEHKRQYGLDAYKKAMKDETPSETIPSPDH